MSSEIKADKWSPASGTSATIGDSGDTYTVPSGATLTASAATVNLPTSIITGVAEKTTLVDADKFLISDSAASGAFKHVQKSNLPSGAWNLVYSDDVSGMGSGTNAYTDSNMFSSTYNFYRIYILDWEPQSDGVNLEIQFKLGGVTRTADYKWNVTRETSNSGGESTNYSNGDDVIRAWYGCGNASGESMSGWFEYTNPTGDTGNWYTTSSMYSGINTSGYAIGGIGAGTNQNSTGPMTGFTIIANTGGLGNYKLRAYGLKQS